MVKRSIRFVAGSTMESFYKQTIQKLLREGVMHSDHRVLVVCGGEEDRDTLKACGLTRVVISNVDERQTADGFAPFEWSYQDAENLTYEDGAFDFVVVHSGLHHCRSPHRGLLEMYRVASRGVVLFEPYDNVVTRLGQRLGIGQEHEHAAVYFNDCRYGGVRNTEIPNYVYRFTKREIDKTIQTHDPVADHEIRYTFAMRIPWVPLKGRKNKVFYYAVVLAYPLIMLASWLYPPMSNNFAAVIIKPGSNTPLHPWLERSEDGVRLNRTWLTERYGPIPDTV